MKEVAYLGFQEKIDGTSFLLVNEVDTHSTVVYDPKKHKLINLPYLKGRLKKGKGGK